MLHSVAGSVEAVLFCGPSSCTKTDGEAKRKAAHKDGLRGGAQGCSKRRCTSRFGTGEGDGRHSLCHEAPCRSVLKHRLFAGF
eukprot:321783-Chlamydomonas_euryale.AAC.2